MRLFFVIMLAVFVVASEGAVVTGSIMSGSGMDINPVAGALVTLRLGDSPEAYPSALADQSGRFTITVPALPEQITVLITAEGVASKTLTLQTAGKDTLSIGTVFCIPKIVTVLEFRGELIDSITGDPLSGVTILFKRTVTADSSIASVITDDNGWFTVNLEVWNDIDGKAFWIVQQTGYCVNVGEVTSAMTISRKTIEMVPEGGVSVAVAGRVVDSVSRQPLEKVKVILSTSYHGTVPDTFETDASGAFSRMVPVGGTTSEVPRLYCSLTAECYCAKVVVVELLPVSSGKIEMGDITLKTDGSSLRPRVAGGNGFPVTAEFPALCVIIDGRRFVPANRAGFRAAASPQLMIVRSSTTAPAKRITLRHTTSFMASRTDHR